jgi:hypothetical protein
MFSSDGESIAISNHFLSLSFAIHINIQLKQLCRMELAATPGMPSTATTAFDSLRVLLIHLCVL